MSGAPHRWWRAVAVAAIGALALAGCGAANRSAQPAVPRALKTPATPARATATRSTPAATSVATTTTDSSTVADYATYSGADLEFGEAGDAGKLGSDGPGGKIRPFAASSPWNTPVAGQPVARDSVALIQSAERRYGVLSGNDSESLRTGFRVIDDPLFINTAAWSDPIVYSDPSGVTTRLVCRQPNLPPPDNLCGDGWRVSSLPIPTSQSPLPQYDGWFTIVDQAQGMAYDLWRARRADHEISYQFMRAWNLTGTGSLSPGTVSARGSGLPLFAGEIAAAEIDAGRIDHALAISVPGPAAGRYVQPASATDGNGLVGSLPEGAHLLLRSNVTLADVLGEKARTDRSRVLPQRFHVNMRAAAAIVRALRTYGAIVVDRSDAPTLYAQQNVRWSQPMRNAAGRLLAPDGVTVLPARDQRNPRVYGTPLLSGSELRGLRLSDFEVIRLPPEMTYPPSAAATAP